MAAAKLARRLLPGVADACLALVLALVLALAWHGLPERSTPSDLGRAARTAIAGHMDVSPPPPARVPDAR